MGGGNGEGQCDNKIRLKMIIAMVMVRHGSPELSRGACQGGRTPAPCAAVAPLHQTHKGTHGQLQFCRFAGQTRPLIVTDVDPFSPKFIRAMGERITPK